MRALTLALLLLLTSCSQEQRIELTCTDYCAQAAECYGDVDEEECVEECSDNVGECDADNVDPTLDDLSACAEETCDDFPGCTIGAGVECAFGI